MPTPTDYDQIAEDYKRAKEHPWRLHVEQYTFLGLVGDVSGKSVLDLACGEGFYTRRLKQRGAARAVGVDLSQRMIDLAREEEARRPLGVEYVTEDAIKLKLGDAFDLVVASYLLNYAQTAEQLLQMCQGIARHLKPGGRFVTVNNNPAQPVETYGRERKYGFTKTLQGPPREGATITYTIFFEDGRTVSLDNYLLSLATHEEAFQKAGLREVRWHAPQLSPEGEKANGRQYWNDFLVDAPINCLDCKK
jgi:toxoflavin synthase